MFPLQLVTEFYFFHLFPVSHFHSLCLTTGGTYTHSSTSNGLPTDLPAVTSARPVLSARLLGLVFADSPKPDRPQPRWKPKAPHCCQKDCQDLTARQPLSSRPCLQPNALCSHLELVTLSRTRRHLRADTFVRAAAPLSRLLPLPGLAVPPTSPRSVTFFHSSKASLRYQISAAPLPPTPIRTNRSFLHIVSQFGGHFCCLTPCICRAYCVACLACNMYSGLLRFPLLLS